ncbi:PAS domain S-box protein [Azospirillum sp. sgz302134]
MERRRWECVLAALPVLIVLLGGALIAAGVWLTADSLERERAEIVRAKEADAANLARAFEENIRQTVRRVDQALVHMRDEYTAHPGSFLARAENWQKTLYADLAFQISATDADGVLRFSNLTLQRDRVDLSDREHFQVHKRSADDALFIGKPVLGRVSGKWSIQFTRRISKPDGSFDGVMVLSVQPGDITGFYGTNDLGVQGSIMLVGMDRVVRARASAVEAPKLGVGAYLVDRPYLDPARPPSGIVYLQSEIDGILRIVAYRRLKDYPLIAIVALGVEEALAPFEERKQTVLTATAVVGAAGLGALLLIAWLIRMHLLHTRRLEATQRLLSDTEERWRLALEAVGDGVWDWNAETDEVFFSRGWKSMLGFREDELSNRLDEWERRVHPEDRGAIQADLSRHLSGETPYYANEHRVLCKDGRYKWILDRGVVVTRRPDGAPLRVVGTHTDITRLKQAEEAVRTSAARLTAILDSAPLGIAIVGTDRRMQIVNPKMEQIVRRGAEELVGATTRVLYEDDEMFEEIGRRLYTVMNRGGLVREEVRMCRGDGTAFWARIVGQRVSMDDSSLGIVWVVEDVTERKAMEKALEGSLKFQRVLIDTVPIPIFVKDSQCRYIDANAAFERWVGMDRKHLRGKTVFDIARPEAARAYEEADRALLAAPHNQVYETRARGADGVDLDIEFSKAVFVDAAGTPAGIVGAMINITERKKAEQALRERQELFERIFVANSAVKMLVDPVEGWIVDANPAAAAFYGYPLDTLRTMRISDVNVLSSDEVKRELERASHEQRTHFLFRHRLASGEVRDVEVYSSPIEVNGRTLLLSLVHDITERRQAEAALRGKTAELERSNAELEAFAYVASHDLRQPLRTINSYLALLQKDLDGTLDEETNEYMEFARQGAQRMDRLIVDLLEYSRVGRKTRPFALHAASDILAAARDNLEAAIAEAQATVTVAPDLPALWGDDNELVRLFQNLIGNAVKYRAADRPPVVRVACAAEEEGWHFTVADNGIGIAPEHFDRIFGIFQRLHSRDQYDGTGVGLAVCKKIVEHHGGRVWVESEPERGSTFHVVLPRRTGGDA